jgi:HSP20 family molecular chaperone IbpA
VDVVADKAEAEFEDGMLKISVPKSQPQIEKEKTKKLEIKKK